MRKCLKCQNELQDNAVFCGFCGFRMNQDVMQQNQLDSMGSGWDTSQDKEATVVLSGKNPVGNTRYGMNDWNQQAGQAPMQPQMGGFYQQTGQAPMQPQMGGFYQQTGQAPMQPQMGGFYQQTGQSQTPVQLQASNQSQEEKQQTQTEEQPKVYGETQVLSKPQDPEQPKVLSKNQWNENSFKEQNGSLMQYGQGQQNQMFSGQTPNTEGEDTSKSEKGSKKMVLIIVIALVVLALLTGGFFAYQHFAADKKDNKEATSGTETVETETSTESITETEETETVEETESTEVSESTEEDERVDTYGTETTKEYIDSDFQFTGSKEEFLQEIDKICENEEFEETKTEYEVISDNTYLKNGNTHTTYYDEQDRIVKSTYEGQSGTGTVNYTYYYLYEDEKAEEIEQTVIFSRRSNGDDDSKSISTTSYVYDEDGYEIFEEYRSFSYSDTDVNDIFEATYDDQGYMTSFAFKEDLQERDFYISTTTYEYDIVDGERVYTRIEDNTKSGSTKSSQEAIFEFDESGKLTDAHGNAEPLMDGMLAKYLDESYDVKKYEFTVEIEYDELGDVTAIELWNGAFSEDGNGAKDIIYIRCEIDQNGDIAREIFYTTKKNLKGDLGYNLRVSCYTYYTEDPLAELKH